MVFVIYDHNDERKRFTWRILLHVVIVGSHLKNIKHHIENGVRKATSILFSEDSL